MWALLSTRLRSWLLLTVLLPVLATVAHKVGDHLEQRHGAPTKTSGALKKVGSTISRHRR